MQGGNLKGSWIPLVEYANRKGVSLSTLRRHIKANKIEFKFESGRYLLFDDFSEVQLVKQRDLSGDVFSDDQSEATRVRLQKLEKLERDLRKAQDEIVELKTLIAFYEEKMPPHLSTS